MDFVYSFKSPVVRIWCNPLNSTGTNTEGILRQAADVEEVDRRIQEYEQGFLFCLKPRVNF